jgi:Mor family transcriptional regulator
MEAAATMPATRRVFSEWLYYKIKAVMQIHGQDCAEDIARKIVQEVGAEYGDQLVFVSKALIRLEEAERNARIRADFNGGNYAEISAREGLSERQVRRIVHRTGWL